MNPPLLLGCLIMHMDAFDRFYVATVVQFVTHESHHETTVIQNERIFPLILRHDDKDVRWIVLRRAT